MFTGRKQAEITAQRPGPPCGPIAATWWAERRRGGKRSGNRAHDAAAGVIGLIAATLAVEHGAVPPTLHFTELNREAPAATEAFAVNSSRSARSWAARSAA
ncbi:hypothetical protein [Embleya sp. NPDC020886]|uniref:hypothetical protein n=1 Tax=Embleya sp. NPDC020886 TaxID=3363980 RepID=UPI00379450B8